MTSEQRSVGLVHDYLLEMRGAERTFAEIAHCWPDAPIYTLLYDPAGTGHRFDERTVRYLVPSVAASTPEGLQAAAAPVPARGRAICR